MPLSADDLSTLSRLLDVGLDVEPIRRTAWLAALPAEQQHLAPALRDMLAEYDSTQGARLLAGPPALAELDDPAVAKAGERVGPYRLLRPIGHGGMGSVWLAERVDGALTRQVALKLPRLAWDAGLAARMARERDIGALLEHPNISRLYDAGVDELGRPYLALEYIEGQPIDTWCAEQGLDVPARLRLFVQVVRAVAYAHGRLVIHRDLKPANLLVSADGQAHLLDFGIARRLNEAVAGLTSPTGPAAPPTQTQELNRALTPRYASPEQISGAPLSVQSDVYSLGVMLYELLTGVSPIAAKRASPAALEDAILEGDAPLASTRSTDRSTARALRGDLDAILAQALQCEPARRYSTAEALAQDIERHLVGLPVLAQPDRWRYRIGKLLGRHRLAFGLAALALTTVLTLAGVAVEQARRAADQARDARQAAERARVVKEFVIDIFKLNAPDTPGALAAQQLPVEAVLERGAGLIDTRFSGQPELQMEMLGVVAQIMLDMGARELAVDYAMRLRSARLVAKAAPDEQAAAAVLLARALLASGIPGEAQRVLAEALALAQAPELRADIQLRLIDRALPFAGLADARQHLAAIRQALPTPPAPLAARIDHAEAKLFAASDDFERARPLFERAIANTTRLSSEPRLAARLRIEYADQLAHQRLGAPAKEQYALAFKALRAAGGEADLEAALGEVDSVGRLAEIQDGSMDYPTASAVFAHTLSVVEKQGQRLPERVRAELDDKLGCIELFFGQAEKGLALARRSAKRLRPNPVFGHDGGCLGWALMMTGRHDDAEAEHQKHLGHLWPSHGCHADCAAHVYVAAAHNRLMQGRYSDAKSLLDTVPPYLVAGAARAQASSAQLLVLVARARVALEQGQLNRTIELLDGVPDGRYMMNDSVELRSEAQCRLGHAAKGLPAWRARAQAKHDISSVSPWLAESRARLGLCELLAGHRNAAHEMARLAHQAFKAQPGVSPAYTRVLSELDGRLARMR